MSPPDELSEVLRRTDETPRYSQLDMERAKEEVRSQERDRTRDSTIAELKAAVNLLPQTFEATARKVFDELLERRRQETSERGWRRADTLILAGQLVTGATFSLVALIISGKI